MESPYSKVLTAIQWCDGYKGSSDYDIGWHDALSKLKGEVQGLRADEEAEREQNPRHTCVTEGISEMMCGEREQAPVGLVEEINKYLAVNVQSGPATEGDQYEQGWNNGQVQLGKDLMEKILSRHKGAKPAEEGLRVGFKLCPDCEGRGHVVGAEHEGLVLCPTCLGAMTVPTTVPAKAEEPKDCGFTLATCPYERCSGITMRDPKAEEPLAVLADRKGLVVGHIGHKKQWDIMLLSVSLINMGKGKTFFAPTYPSCEAKARAFLMGLPDKGEMK